jgi:hypothetical protein
MAERIPQSVSKLVIFRAFLSSDGKTPATGKTIAVTISKNGAAFGNPNVGALNATEISSGFYKFTLDTTDTGTQGPVAWRGAEATIGDAGDVFTVADPHNAGFDALPSAAANASGGVHTNGVGAGQFSVDGSGNADANVINWKGATAPAMSGDAFARLGAPAGASTAADIAAIKSDTGTILTDVNTGAGAIYTRLGAPANGSIAADVAAVGASAASADNKASTIISRIPTALSANGNIKSDLEEIAGNTGGASRLDRSARAIATGTVGNASSTTSVVTSSLSPAAAVTDQFLNRVVIFDKDTTTANLRGQSAVISGSTAGGVLTVSALTTAPVNGDTFTIT